MSDPKRQTSLGTRRSYVDIFYFFLHATSQATGIIFAKILSQFKEYGKSREYIQHKQIYNLWQWQWGQRGKGAVVFILTKDSCISSWRLFFFKPCRWMNKTIESSFINELHDAVEYENVPPCPPNSACALPWRNFGSQSLLEITPMRKIGLCGWILCTLGPSCTTCNGENIAADSASEVLSRYFTGARAESTEETSMAKRRPDDVLLHDSPSKKHCRAFCKLDMRVGGMVPVGGVNPPSLLALLGSRARKRPRYFEDSDKEQQDEEPSASLCRRDTRKHAAGGLPDQTSGDFCERRSSSSICKKRTRDFDSETVRDDKEKVS